MKLLWGHKDGGPKSRVWMWGIESKRYGSLLLLKFGEGSREAFHTHAFNSLSWVLRGRLREKLFTGIMHSELCYYQPSFKPVLTSRHAFHKVTGLTPVTWVISLRGPWSKYWEEYLPGSKRRVMLTHGRKEC